MLLRVEHLTVFYEKARALQDVSLEVREGSIVTIIGANGAGKSTILRAISGLAPVSSGEIWFRDTRINAFQMPNIVKLGIIHVPEGRRLFPFLTVLVNLKLGATARKDRAAIDQDLEKVFNLFPILRERRNQPAGTLSGGEQQMLAIGRGLMANPRLLMLDEPSVGLAPIVVEEVGDVIKSIHERGVSVLLVEQNLSLALQVADTGYALHVGKIVLKDQIDRFKGNEIVKQAYLGG